jgi:hypothetical protein
MDRLPGGVDVLLGADVLREHGMTVKGEVIKLGATQCRAKPSQEERTGGRKNKEAAGREPRGAFAQYRDRNKRICKANFMKCLLFHEIFFLRFLIFWIFKKFKIVKKNIFSGASYSSVFQDCPPKPFHEPFLFHEINRENREINRDRKTKK